MRRRLLLVVLGSLLQLLSCNIFDMGWDVSIERVHRERVTELPCTSEDAFFVRDLSLAEVEHLLAGFAGVRVNGSRPDYAWFSEDEAVMMELTAHESSVFVGAAKLEPLLALYTHLESARPGWLLLDCSRYQVHDPRSLRLELARRQALADELRKKPSR